MRGMKEKTEAREKGCDFREGLEDCAINDSPSINVLTEDYYSFCITLNTQTVSRRILYLIDRW